MSSFLKIICMFVIQILHCIFAQLSILIFRFIVAFPQLTVFQWRNAFPVFERLMKEFDLDGLSYYYHGAQGGEYETLRSGFIVGHSLLTAKGIPCAGEGGLKTCLAMKICDLLGVGGSSCEIFYILIY